MITMMYIQRKTKKRGNTVVAWRNTYAISLQQICIHTVKLFH